MKKYCEMKETGSTSCAACQRVDKPIGTLADVEKGRDIFAKQIRRRTRVR